MPKSLPFLRYRSRSRAGALALLAGVTLLLSAAPAFGVPVTRAARGPARVGAPPPPGSAVPAPPANRGDLQAWLAYQRALGSPSLSAAAQVFYRRGVETLRSGAQEDGVRMLRGACQLDPDFLAPRLALLGHFGFGNASQSLMELARTIDLAKRHFPLQHYLVTAVAFQGILATFLAALVAALYVAWRRREAVRHAYEEFLGQVLSPRVARAGAWALLALPYLVGLGLALPTAFTLAALWPVLRKSERFLFLFLAGTLVALPLAYSTVGKFATPDADGRGPFYGTAGVANAPFSEARLEEFSKLAGQHPDNPFLHFATGWMAARGGQVALAREKFEAAGRLWPNEPRVPNNLGNLAAARGQTDEAERLYRQASSLDPGWAMPHYNLGQLYARQFRYAEASEEMARATSYDFDMVRELQAEAQLHPGDPLPEAWGWLRPRTFWDALLAPQVEPSPARTPKSWRGWLELRGAPVALLAALLTLLGAFVGAFLRARLPVRQCSNCDAALCRRCAARRRDQVFCAACATALREATTPEFARLLLSRRRRTLKRGRARWNLVFATLPGLGPLLLDRLALAWTLLVVAAVAAARLLAASGPFPYDPRIGLLGPGQVHGGALGVLAGVCLASLLFYLILRDPQDLREIQTDSARKPAARLPRAA